MSEVQPPVGVVEVMRRAARYVQPFAGRFTVNTDDIQKVALPALRHRGCIPGGHAGRLLSQSG